MSRRLTLPLKKKWFDMIKSGEKQEEYREITEYWIRRLINKEHWYELPNPYGIICECILNQCDFDPFNDFDEVEFTCGYPKKGDKERRLLFKNPKICVTYGIQDWGAEEGKKYFVITWEDRI